MRWSIPLLVLAALGGTTMDGIFAVGTILTEPRPTLLSNSPGGNYRALLYHRDTDNSPTTQLVLEHHWHGIFLGRLIALESLPEATVNVRWTNPHHSPHHMHRLRSRRHRPLGPQLGQTPPLLRPPVTAHSPSNFCKPHCRQRLAKTERCTANGGGPPENCAPHRGQLNCMKLAPAIKNQISQPMAKANAGTKV